jgi:ABC-type Mn2+/Zn2+ transport system permease subunit
VIIATVTISVATVGTLLVTVLLIVPSLLGDTGKGGIKRYAVTVTAIGITGSISGFLCALAIDLPPGISTSAGIALAGMITMGLRR